MLWFLWQLNSRLPRTALTGRRGFTLLEVLVTLAVMSVILVALVQYLQSVDQVWKSSSADPFAEAQEAFETICQNVASATLEPYQDYADSSGAFRAGNSFVPDHVARRSDLAFVCGPGAGVNGLITGTGKMTVGDGLFFVTPAGYTQTQAHSGLQHLLNVTGYFVEFGDDSATPDFVTTGSHAYRWRLKQILQPSEFLSAYASTTSSALIANVLQGAPSTSVIAENVIALIVLPERAASDAGVPLSTDYRYDSRDTGNSLTLAQLPARVKLVLVAIDPASAERLAGQSGTQPPSLLAADSFTDATQLNQDLNRLDAVLTDEHVLHRIFQRDILLTSAQWSNSP